MQDLIRVYEKTRYLYEKKYDIHLCGIDEIEEVISFLDDYWQKGHILTKSRQLLDWQHYDKKNKRYNFVIAKSKKTGEIHGLIGFIFSSIFDENIKTPIRWGAIWKVRDIATKGLGVFLKGYMETTVPSIYVGGIGLSKYSKEIDTKLGEQMGQLAQYYIANPNFKEYRLIDCPSYPKNVQITVEDKKIFMELTEKDFCSWMDITSPNIMPYKSTGYYVNRYYRHPIYRYGFIGIKNLHGTVDAVFVYRKCSAEDAAGIFIVDYIGKTDVLKGSYSAFVEFLQSKNAEYISFPCSGIEDEILREAGFLLRDDSDVIVPVYYEPFVRTNVNLDYHYWTKDGLQDAIIVKGDADQDRPNKWKEGNECD